MENKDHLSTHQVAVVAIVYHRIIREQLYCFKMLDLGAHILLLIFSTLLIINKNHSLLL